MNKVKGGDIVPEEEDAEIMTPYEDYSVDELREAFRKIFFLSDLTDADLEEMDQILAILREKDPLPPGRSVEELWEEFKTVYMNKELADLGIPDDLEEVNNAEPAPDVVSPLPSKGDAHPVRPKR